MPVAPTCSGPNCPHNKNRVTDSALKRTPKKTDDDQGAQAPGGKKSPERGGKPEGGEGGLAGQLKALQEKIAKMPKEQQKKVAELLAKIFEGGGGQQPPGGGGGGQPPGGIG